FQLPEGDREAQEDRESGEPRELKETREEKKGGVILIVVKNVMPEQISLRSSRNELLVFTLSDQAFQRGEFKYDLLVEAKKAGKAEVKGYVIPFLAAIAGQEFSFKSAAQ